MVVGIISKEMDNVNLNKFKNWLNWFLNAVMNIVKFTTEIDKRLAVGFLQRKNLYMPWE